MKTRLDKLLVDRGLAETREKAQALIIAGNVLVNSQPANKPGLPGPTATGAGAGGDAESRALWSRANAIRGRDPEAECGLGR